jgi:nucleoside-diphosphate-sugar epimerase
VIQGNLLSREDCAAAVRDAAVIYHLAAGIDKSYAGAFMNSVVSTRNLLDAVVRHSAVRRFVNVSSFAVYSNRKLRRGAVLDETCEIEEPAYGRGEAYCFGKIKQDDLVVRYGREYGLPYVIVRPGAVYGPGKAGITGRVGVSTFGIFLHLGGAIELPLTYVDNCADAIVMAGLQNRVEGEVFNVVDDEPISSRRFLRLYKQNVKRFVSVPIPYPLTYCLCYLWEKYSSWSEGQLPPVFNRSRCSAEWKGNRYSNQKAKCLLGWTPKVPPKEALERYFRYQATERKAD